MKNLDPSGSRLEPESRVTGGKLSTISKVEENNWQRPKERKMSEIEDRNGGSKIAARLLEAQRWFSLTTTGLPSHRVDSTFRKP